MLCPRSLYFSQVEQASSVQPDFSGTHLIHSHVEHQIRGQLIQETRWQYLHPLKEEKNGSCCALKTIFLLHPLAYLCELQH